MEPESNSPNIGHINSSVERVGLSSPSEIVDSKESIVNSSETASERVISEPGVAKNDTSGLATIFPTPVVSDDATSADDSLSPVLVPMIASDDDLIEKEWVDRAKKIVSDNRDDPYKQEEAVIELQKDYQKKRYGRGMGGTS